MFLSVILKQKFFILYVERGSVHLSNRLFGSRCFGEQNTSSIIAHLSHNPSLIKGIAQHCIRELINGWEYVRLGDICKITTGKLDANAQVENGQYPFFTCAERPFNIDSYAFDTEALLISGNGANLGYINYYKGKFNAYQRTYVLDHFSVNIQYVKWALKVLLPQRISIEKSSSNTPYIVLSTLADLKIPIPNNSKQNHIANLMMSFERKLSTQLALSDLYNKQKQYLLRQMFI